MTINGCQEKGIEVDRKKNYIIKKYASGIKINILAGEFFITTDTLCRRLKSWGIKIRKGDFTKKKIKMKGHWKRNFSKEFVANQAAITKHNGDKVKYIMTVNSATDTRLVRNILCKAYI